MVTGRFARRYAIFALVAVAWGESPGAEGGWSTVVRSSDIIVGSDIQRLNPRRNWSWKFDGGVFEVAVRKSAIPVAAPQCRMDYLILKMPMYYPENPAQATAAERQAVYDALTAIKRAGQGGLRIRFNALGYLRNGKSGPELTTCNIYFALPLDKDAARILP